MVASHLFFLKVLCLNSVLTIYIAQTVCVAARGGAAQQTLIRIRCYLFLLLYLESISWHLLHVMILIFLSLWTYRLQTGSFILLHSSPFIQTGKLNAPFVVFPDLSIVNSTSLPLSHLFRYFKIRHFVQALFPAFPSLPPSQVWEEGFFFHFDPLQKLFISRIYNKLLSHDSIPVTKVKVARERELGLNFEDSWWHVALKKIHTSSTCTRLTLIQFKVLFRIHDSKARQKNLL